MCVDAAGEDCRLFISLVFGKKIQACLPLHVMFEMRHAGFTKYLQKNFHTLLRLEYSAI